MKTKKCSTCGKRYVRQQDWKEGKELETCLTCRSFKEVANQVKNELINTGKSLGIDISISLEFKPIKSRDNKNNALKTHP